MYNIFNSKCLDLTRICVKVSLACISNGMVLIGSWVLADFFRLIMVSSIFVRKDLKILIILSKIRLNMDCVANFLKL